MGRKSNQFLRPLLAHHLPESGRKRKNPGEYRRLPDIINKKRNWLKTGLSRIFRSQIIIGQTTKIFRENNGINIKRRNNNIFIRNSQWIDYLFFGFFVAQASFEPWPAISPGKFAGCQVVKSLKNLSPNSF